MRVGLVLFLTSCVTADTMVIYDYKTNYVTEVDYVIETNYTRVYETNYMSNITYTTNTSYSVFEKEVANVREYITKNEYTTWGGIIGAILLLLRLMPGKIGDKLFDLFWSLLSLPFKYLWKRLKKQK